jgi:uroporphyrinogen decarboxylase
MASFRVGIDSYCLSPLRLDPFALLASVHPRSTAAAARTSVPDPRSSLVTTARELVKQTLEFQGPARLARQLWVLPWAAKRYPQELDRLERDFPADITTIPVFCSEPVLGGGNAHSVGTFVDAWGCTFLNLQEGIIGQVKQPLVTDWSDTSHVRFPRERLSIDKEQIAEFCRSSDRFVLAGTCPRPFERLQFLRGPENLYLDLSRPSAELVQFLERLHAFYVEELRLWAETEVDALTFMDDWGSQRSLLVAPELWRELFKPLYAEYVSIAHEHGKYAFMHSDGYIIDLIPDLIEIELDALNSQVFCMGVEELGRRFAGELTFWGELDQQQLLPRATTAEIAEAALGMGAAFHRDGGFIAQCEFGPGARPENVYAFFAACAGG